MSMKPNYTTHVQCRPQDLVPGDVIHSPGDGFSHRGTQVVEQVAPAFFNMVLVKFINNNTPRAFFTAAPVTIERVHVLD